VIGFKSRASGVPIADEYEVVVAWWKSDPTNEPRQVEVAYRSRR
jgi:hypothetical protein